MTIKESLTASMTAMAKDPAVLFLGYGLKKGRANGTLKDVPATQILETPVAESLMVGMAIGLALKRRKAVVFFERFDFILLALDAITNHLDKIEKESRGEFKPGILLRVCVGGRQRPLFTGSTHTGDHTKALQHLVSFPVERLLYPEQVRQKYREAHDRLPHGSTMLVEYRDLY